MNLKRRISALLLVLVMCLSIFAVPAYAYGNDPDPDYEIVVPTKAPLAETQPKTETQSKPQEETEPTYSEIVPGVSFANDGNVTTRDLLYDEATNKQFISIETKNGAIFYIVIDYDKPVDEDSNLYETYFLNLVDEADLMALLETEETPVTCSCTQRCAVGQINMYCEICATSMVDCIGTEPETEPTVPETEPPVEEEESNGSAVLAIVLFIAMVGAFGFYYLKMRKPAPKTKGDTNLDEYDYGMDEDEEYAEFDSYDETEDTV